ncbi:Mov34/MPN/PAD-1 family protein [Sutcliffiella horikoshii]|uniref:Mov34/MPN/PAD-1 family protein n=1 Tax=Sutcliffiella horikoshii TaxID=79883 RepID=UPI003CEE6076
MSDLKYVNNEGSFGVVITDKMVHDIFEKCKDAYPNETGGILIGHYSMDLKLAHITIIIGAPRDSKMGKCWFHRGTNGLQRSLDKAWDEHGHYYLGEWHYHPGGAPHPSFHDIKEMKKISKNKNYKCPEPILIIAGNTSFSHWNLGVYVFKQNKYIPLQKKISAD